MWNVPLFSLSLCLRSKLCACVSPFPATVARPSLDLFNKKGEKRRGRREFTSMHRSRQWHGPPHSSYLHSFNATWGLWNVQATPWQSRTYGGTAHPCPLDTTTATMVQSVFYKGGPSFRGKIEIQTRDAQRKRRITLVVSVNCN